MASPRSTGLCETELCRRCVAAMGASVVSILLTTPFEVVKVLRSDPRLLSLQGMRADARGHTHSPSPRRFAFAGCPNMCHTTALGQARWAALCPPECYVYLSTMDALKKIARQEGVRVLWRGTRESLIMAVPLVGIYLPLYDSLHHRLSSCGALAPVFAGITARTFSMFCVTPIDILKVRLQSMNNQSSISSIIHAFDWGQGKGPLHRARALWRGFGATVARDVPFTAVYWGMLEPIRKNLLPRAEDHTLTEVLFANSFASAICGVVSSIVTQPMDVVKTRIQTSQTEGGTASTRALDVYRQIYRKEGMRGLFSGMGPRILRIGPSSAIVISSYELLKKIL